MRLGPFTANVVVDGKVLEEYDVDVKNPTEATCWIPSEEGKSFSVQWESHEATGSTGAMGCVWVDGIGCGAIVDCQPGVGRKSVFSQFVGTTTYRKLMFARIQLSDDDSLLNKETPKNLGEICLKISRGSVILIPRIVVDQDLSVLDDKTFHERTKKATVHCVGFGTETARQFSVTQPRLIPSNDPVLTFAFKYQPLSVLQANGIAPKPVSNDAGAGDEPRPSPRDLTPADDPTMEDIKPAELHDRIRGLENELKRLRELQGNSEDQKPKRVKREERSRPLFTPGEIIDLT